MSALEVIGSIVAVIAAVLGGMWAIMKYAFNLGEFKNRVEEIDGRTHNAKCDLHDRDIDASKLVLEEIRGDVVAIKSLLVIKHKNAASVFSMKNSPRQLNDNGRKLFEAVEGKEFLEENRDFLFSKIDESNPKTALDVENAANIVCSSSTDNDIFNGLKNFVYNTPAFPVKDANGEESTYDITLADVCFVLSIPLRDMYLEAHPEIPKE